MEELGTFIGIVIGLVGLGVGYWQNRQKANLEKIIRANSWFNYQRANNSNGTLQLALDLYKKVHKDNLSPEVIEQLAKADAFGQEVYKESVRQIHFAESSFKRTDIEVWEKEGKISEKAKPIFYQLADKESSSNDG